MKNSTARGSYQRKKKLRTVLMHILLAVLALIWLFPIFWIIMTSLRGEPGSYFTTFFPKKITFANYTRLFTETDILNFPRWFANTLVVACVTCVISTFFVLAVSYSMSRMRFKMRKPFMNVALVLGMFPAFMSMIAVYYILKGLNLTEGVMKLVALVLVYSASAGLTFYIAKGFFDTIPKSVDEAAMIDGASMEGTFFKIIFPLLKPIIITSIVFTALSIWNDYILASTFLSVKEVKTLPLMTYSFLATRSADYAPMMAGLVLMMLPVLILYMVGQKYIIGGIVAGSVKG